MKARLSTAYHEAGHAVVAVALGWKVGSVSIEPDADTSGRVDLRKNRRRRSFEYRIARMTIALAGREAERRAGYRPRHFTAQSDYTAVADEALDLAGGDAIEANLFVKVAARRAARTVERHWTAIAALAKRLHKEQTIDGSALVSWLSCPQGPMFSIDPPVLTDSANSANERK